MHTYIICNLIAELYVYLIDVYYFVVMKTVNVT